ncbi:MAG: DUF4058 family protein [Gemmataceae bacterium]|nr:DUF4058 family protein [Gemmataceae bacterium]
MPLLDHFHPPLYGPHRWEGFHHAWATFITQQLNREALPRDYFAVPEISIGPELEIDVATLEKAQASGAESQRGATGWSPPRPEITVPVSFAHLEGYEVLVYQDLGGPQLRGAIELVSPANKDREGTRRTFAAKCAGYLRHGIGLVIVDVVTARSANLHEELFNVLEVKGRRGFWQSSSGLYAVAYRAVTVRKKPRVEVWPETLTLGKALPVMPLWLSLDLCVPVRLEESYLVTCQSLRISA